MPYFSVKGQNSEIEFFFYIFKSASLVNIYLNTTTFNSPTKFLLIWCETTTSSYFVIKYLLFTLIFKHNMAHKSWQFLENISKQTSLIQLSGNLFVCFWKQISELNFVMMLIKTIPVFTVFTLLYASNAWWRFVLLKML